MRIGKTDYDLKHQGRVHQAVLEVVPEEEAVSEEELHAAYDAVVEDGKPSFEQVVGNLGPFLSRQRLGSQIFYVRREPWLSTQEVAKALGVSKRTVQAWYQQGKLLGRQVGGRIRFAAEAVEEWVKRGSPPSPRTMSDLTVTELWDNEKDAGYDRI